MTAFEDLMRQFVEFKRATKKLLRIVSATAKPKSITVFLRKKVKYTSCEQNLAKARKGKSMRVVVYKIKEFNPLPKLRVMG